MNLPHENLTPILGDSATYNPNTETTPQFMNGKFEELLENDKAIKQQINVLSEKIAFSLTATTGVTINSQQCYKQGDKFYIIANISCESGYFSTTAHNTLANLPFVPSGAENQAIAMGRKTNTSGVLMGKKVVVWQVGSSILCDCEAEVSHIRFTMNGYL